MDKLKQFMSKIKTMVGSYKMTVLINEFYIILTCDMA